MVAEIAVPFASVVKETGSDTFNRVPQPRMSKLATNRCARNVKRLFPSAGTGDGAAVSAA